MKCLRIVSASELGCGFVMNCAVNRGNALDCRVNALLPNLQELGSVCAKPGSNKVVIRNAMQNGSACVLGRLNQATNDFRSRLFALVVATVAPDKSQSDLRATLE